MTLIELYSKDDCQLCDEAQAVLERVQKEIPFQLRVIKLLPGEENFEEFREDFPVVHINKRFAFKHRVHENMLRIRLQQVATDDRPATLEDDVDAQDSKG